MEKEKKKDAKKIRCFIAVEIPSQIKTKIEPLLQELHAQGIKPIAIENIHMTLKFLGYVSNEMLENITKALSHVKLHAFSFSVQGIGCFPMEKRPCVIWIGCESVEFEKLAQEINTALTPLFPKEACTAHLTIARVKDIKNAETKVKIQKFIAKHKNDLFGTIMCTNFALKESKLQKSGSVYSTLKTFSLRA